MHLEFLDEGINSHDPNKIIANRELNEVMLRFCSLLCVLLDKKLTQSGIFMLLVENKDIRELYKSTCEIDNDREALKLFLAHNNLLGNSKVIKKYAKSIVR